MSYGFLGPSKAKKLGGKVRSDFEKIFKKCGFSSCWKFKINAVFEEIFIHLIKLLRFCQKRTHNISHDYNQAFNVGGQSSILFLPIILKTFFFFTCRWSSIFTFHWNIQILINYNRHITSFLCVPSVTHEPVFLEMATYKFCLIP